MANKEQLLAMGVTEDVLAPHLRKNKRGKPGGEKNTNTTSLNLEQISLQCAEDIALHQFINIGVDGKAYNPAGTSKVAMAFSITAGTTGQVINAVLSGVENVVSDSVDVGKRIYLSDTLPYYSITPILASNKYLQIVGRIKSTSELIIDIEPAEKKL